MVVCVACLKIVSRNLCGGSEVLCPSSSTRQNNGQMQWCDTKHQKYSGGHSQVSSGSGSSLCRNQNPDAHMTLSETI